MARICTCTIPIDVETQASQPVAGGDDFGMKLCGIDQLPDWDSGDTDDWNAAYRIEDPIAQLLLEVIDIGRAHQRMKGSAELSCRAVYIEHFVLPDLMS